MDDPRPAAVSNTPEYTVSEVSGAVKRTLETNFGRIRVRGEVTEMKRYPSGHIYLSLKDENAKLSGIVWRTAVSRLGMLPENGTEVIATGRISAFSERSSYQLIIERMEYAGVGALLARVEMIRQRLAAEGLFDATRKLALPGLPRLIGVVTSERGAVLQDIRTTIARRFPRSILVWPVPVQGDGAAERIAAAIAGFDAMAVNASPARPDVLIVARGGGSLEDLMAFNEEIVLRAVAACRIPLISAVGHETDTTLIDFVSDRRAPTPTAAAEMAIPARADLVADLVHKGSRLVGALHRLAQERRLRLSQIERQLPDVPTLLGAARQRLDDRAERAARALPALVARRRMLLTATERRLPDPHNLIAGVRASLRDQSLRLLLSAPGLLAARRSGLALTSHRLQAAVHRVVASARGQGDRVIGRVTAAPLRFSLREARAHLTGLAARLDSASPLAILQRGYVLVTDPAGHPVLSAASVQCGDRLRLRFGDGQVDAVAQGGGSGRGPASGSRGEGGSRAAGRGGSAGKPGIGDAADAGPGDGVPSGDGAPEEADAAERDTGGGSRGAAGSGQGRRRGGGAAGARSRPAAAGQERLDL